MPENTQPDTRLLEIRNGLTFMECLIDEATGYNLHVMGKFADFVYDCIFLKFTS